MQEDLKQRFEDDDANVDDIMRKAAALSTRVFYIRQGRRASRGHAYVQSSALIRIIICNS